MKKAKRAVAPNPIGLPVKLKAGIESLCGMSMDNVNVHHNSLQPAQFNALAYAQGNDIHVAPGQEKHLPHEAWHLVQQAQGRVKPTMQTKARGRCAGHKGGRRRAAKSQSGGVNRSNSESISDCSAYLRQMRLYVTPT
jgi:Domain of unknown function (DUF4157)